MNSERKEFLSVVPMPPARLDLQETGWHPASAPHGIPILVNTAHLKPLARSLQASQILRGTDTGYTQHK